jgi:hypothetical protein
MMQARVQARPNNAHGVCRGACVRAAMQDDDCYPAADAASIALACVLGLC